LSCNRSPEKTFNWARRTIPLKPLGLSAIARAQEIAGEKTVALHGTSAVQQALKAGLLDEFHLHIAHVLLGSGVRLFDHLGTEPIHLERIATRETPGATHLKFRVLK
jgi:dihydrofolate reductase